MEILDLTFSHETLKTIRYLAVQRMEEGERPSRVILGGLPRSSVKCSGFPKGDCLKPIDSPPLGTELVLLTKDLVDLVHGVP